MRLPFDGLLDEGAYYLRAQVRLSSVAEFQGSLMTMLSIRHQSEGDVGERMALNVFPDGALELVVQSNLAGERYFLGAAGDLPREQWACVLMTVQVDDVAGSVTVSVNGSPLLVEENLDTRAPDPYEMLVVSNGDGLAQGEFYVDDLVVSTLPLACD